MDAPLVAQPDLRPSRAQIEALLAGLPMISVIRPAVLDAFEEQGLLAFTKPDPQIAVDDLGRFRQARVNQALERFDEVVRNEVISVLEKLHAIV
jgi:hypothetical protein